MGSLGGEDARRVTAPAPPEMSVPPDATVPPEMSVCPDGPGRRAAGRAGTGDDLAVYLCAIAPHLLVYLDAERDISADALRHVQCYAVALLEDLVLPEHVDEDWPDFFHLTVAFVLAHGSRRLGRLARQSAIFEGSGDDPLTDADRAFLATFLAELHVSLARREP